MFAPRAARNVARRNYFESNRCLICCGSDLPFFPRALSLCAMGCCEGFLFALLTIVVNDLPFGGAEPGRNLPAFHSYAKPHLQINPLLRVSQNLGVCSDKFKIKKAMNPRVRMTQLVSMSKNIDMKDQALSVLFTIITSVAVWSGWAYSPVWAEIGLDRESKSESVDQVFTYFGSNNIRCSPLDIVM